MNLGREKIDTHGFNYVRGNKDETQKIIAQGLETIDIFNNIRVYTPDHYLKEAEVHPQFMDIHKQLIVLCDNFNNQTFDTHMTIEEKLTCLENSIYLAKQSFLEMRYTNEISDSTNTICQNMFEHCYDKLETEEGLHILKLLKKLDVNFIIKFDDGYAFYPLIADMLIDTISLNIGNELNKGLVNLIKPKITLHQIAIDVLQTSGFKFLSKILFIKDIGRKNNHVYLLHAYTKQFDCDLSIMRQLYLEILFDNPKNHLTALKTKKFFIGTIQPREFMLSNSRMVINFINKPTKIKAIEPQKHNIWMIPFFQGNLITK